MKAWLKNNTLKPAARRAARLAIWLGGLAAVGLVLVFVWRRFGIGLIPCPLHFVTGLYCPGCGTFRALNALLSGQWRQAFGYNVLVTSTLPLLAALVIAEIIRYIRGTPRRTRRFEKPAIIALIIAFIIFGILRNLPWFTFLAP